MREPPPRNRANRDARGDGNGGPRWSGDGLGRVGAAMMLPTVEAGLTMLEDFRELAAIAADQIEDNIRLLEDGWRDLSSVQNADDLSRVAGRFTYALTRQLATGSQRVSQLATDSASRRVRANTAWASTMLRQTRAATQQAAQTH